MFSDFAPLAITTPPWAARDSAALLFIPQRGRVDQVREFTSADRDGRRTRCEVCAGHRLFLLAASGNRSPVATLTRKHGKAKGRGRRAPRSVKKHGHAFATVDYHIMEAPPSHLHQI